MAFEVTLRPNIAAHDGLQLLWHTRLDFATQRDLQEDLDDLPGVDSVRVTRYSGYVRFAAHVTTLSDLSAAVTELLTLDDEDRAAQLGGPATICVEP